MPFIFFFWKKYPTQRKCFQLFESSIFLHLNFIFSKSAPVDETQMFAVVVNDEKWTRQTDSTVEHSASQRQSCFTSGGNLNFRRNFDSARLILFFYFLYVNIQHTIFNYANYFQAKTPGKFFYLLESWIFQQISSIDYKHFPFSIWISAWMWLLNLCKMMERKF